MKKHFPYYLVVVFIGLVYLSVPVRATSSLATVPNSTSNNDTIFIDDFRLIRLYKKQLRVYDQLRSMTDSTAIQQLILDSLFTPYPATNQTCLYFTPEQFVELHLRLLDEELPTIKAAADHFDQINLDSILQSMAVEVPKFSRHQLTGTFYLHYFIQPMCAFCGCDKNTMQMNMLLPINQELAKLSVLIPHEINHNTYDLSTQDFPDRETVLYKSIDEGFANFFAQQYNQIPVAEAFAMTPTEYNWFVANELEIKKQVAPILFSEVEEDWDPLGLQVADSFMKGSPGNIGYFIGYRMIEEYLTKHPETDWRTIYTMPARQLLAESGYFAGFL